MLKALVGFFQQIPKIMGVFFTSLQELPPTHPYTLQRKLCCKNNEERFSYRLLEFIKVLTAFFFWRAYHREAVTGRIWISVFANGELSFQSKQLQCGGRGFFTCKDKAFSIDKQEGGAQPTELFCKCCWFIFLCRISMPDCFGDWSETWILKPGERIPFWGK